ncbi:hypothetical protein ON010_g5127 [Phytophthora cinnamomi]|nr:hypothetical protein ON010_g5127 [Phytophthora cinnamomi]
MVNEVAEDLVVVEAVADDELVGDVEAHEVGLEAAAPRVALLQQAGHAHGRGRVLAQHGHELGHGLARVDDVLDQQQVLAPELGQVGARDLHVARALGARVALDADEVEGEGHVVALVVLVEEPQLVHERVEEGAAALEHAQQVHRLALVGVADVLRQLLHAVLDQALGDEHGLDRVQVVVRYEELRLVSRAEVAVGGPTAIVLLLSPSKAGLLTSTPAPLMSVALVDSKFPKIKSTPNQVAAFYFRPLLTEDGDPTGLQGVRQDTQAYAQNGLHEPCVARAVRPPQARGRNGHFGEVAFEICVLHAELGQEAEVVAPDPVVRDCRPRHEQPHAQDEPTEESGAYRHSDNEVRHTSGYEMHQALGDHERQEDDQQERAARVETREIPNEKRRAKRDEENAW